MFGQSKFQNQNSKIQIGNHQAMYFFLSLWLFFLCFYHLFLYFFRILGEATNLFYLFHFFLPFSRVLWIHSFNIKSADRKFRGGLKWSEMVRCKVGMENN